MDILVSSTGINRDRISDRRKDPYTKYPCHASRLGPTLRLEPHGRLLLRGQLFNNSDSFWRHERRLSSFLCFPPRSIRAIDMHFSPLQALTAVLLVPLATADGLYTKSSPVLQVTGKNFDQLVKKSTKASVS